ncbi:quinone oxidoreductase family protein [Cellulomonas sp.]|uniref:quinone oxidoreductase family protein n=1 Tax=Cellulomonas sp. TaxID=40001 RepID=UPI003BA9B489
MGVETETRTMQAIVQSAYGAPETVLTHQTVARPVPKADEVLIKVHASSLNFADVAMVTGRPSLIRAVMGLLRPRHTVPGRDVAGVVEAVGADVTDLAAGDDVYAEATAGSWAEYVAVPARFVGRKPATLSFADAATLPLAAGTALDCVAGVRPGQKVLVNGASGGSARSRCSWPGRSARRSRGCAAAGTSSWSRGSVRTTSSTTTGPTSPARASATTW